MLPTITQSDLGFPKEPGEYAFGDARVEVGDQQLSAWMAEPDASFDSILLTRVGDTVLRFALGARHR